MITFYATSFHTLSSWALRARVWVHTHPWKARTLAVLLLITYFTVITSQAAHASWLLPEGTTFTDTHGVPIEAYATINVNAGDIWTPWKVIANFVVQLVWMVQYYLTTAIIWLFSFLLSFEWVGWLATPFNALAVWLQSVLSGVGWIPFALTIAALAGGAAILFGKTSAGVWELVVALVMSVLAVGALANPVATLTATGGMLENAQEWGGSLAAAIVVDDTQTSVDVDTMSAAVSSQLVDVFIRVPHQVISYGMVLPDNCQEPYTAAMTTADPITGFVSGSYAAFSSCLPDFAKSVSDNPGALNIMFAFVNSGGVTTLLIFALAIAALLLVSVFFFLVAAVKSMILVYLAILPINREPLWRSISDTFMGLISLVVMTCLLSLYLKLTTWIMTASGGIPHNFRMIILSLLLIIMVVLIWRARKATLKAGRMAAGPLSRLGLGMKGSPRDANALLKMGAVTSMAKNAYDLLKRDGSKSVQAAPTPAALPEPDPIQLHQVPNARQPRPQQASLTTGGGRGSSGSGATVPDGGPRPHGSAGVRKAIGAGTTVVNVAKGAAAGGVAGAAGAAALEAGKGLAGRAARAAAQRAQRNDVGELKVVTVSEMPSRIQVDKDGVATARRMPTIVHDVSSLPPTPAPASPRALERRRQLEAFRPKELTRQ